MMQEAVPVTRPLQNHLPAAGAADENMKRQMSGQAAAHEVDAEPGTAQSCGSAFTHAHRPARPTHPWSGT